MSPTSRSRSPRRACRTGISITVEAVVLGGDASTRRRPDIEKARRPFRGTRVARVPMDTTVVGGLGLAVEEGGPPVHHRPTPFASIGQAFVSASNRERPEPIGGAMQTRERCN